MKDAASHYIDQLLNKYNRLSTIKESILIGFDEICNAFSKGNKLLICGNGGSAADADHIVGELMKGFKLKRELNAETRDRISDFDPTGAIAAKLQHTLPAINLSAHSSLITAICNDNSADMMFAQQVFGYGQKGDVLLGISTSGNSQNILNAAIVAKALGMKAIGLTGSSGGKMNGVFDVIINVPEKATADIQELHLPIYHTLCAMLEEEFFGEGE